MDDPPVTSSTALLLSLPIQPALLPLLTASPIRHPSLLPPKLLSGFISRLSSTISSRDVSEADKKAGLRIAAGLVSEDEEGWVLDKAGKGWIGNCTGAITVVDKSIGSLSAHLELLHAVVRAAGDFPLFERENVQPILGKLSISLLKLLERLVSSDEPHSLLGTLSIYRELLLLHPAPARPTVPSLRSLLISVLLCAPPALSETSQTALPSSVVGAGHRLEIRQAAANLLAALYHTAGKVQAPQAWSGEMRDALGGLGGAMSVLVAEGWAEDPLRTQPPPPPAKLPGLPTDSVQRVQTALTHLEGWTELILSLLRHPTPRPVPIPLAQLISASMRLLSLFPSTPIRDHVSPQVRAALLGALPRIWVCGSLLLGATTIACGDHLFPHLEDIFDTLIYAFDTIPLAYIQPHKVLLRLSSLLLSLYPPALLSPAFSARLLKHALARLDPLLEHRPSSASTKLAAPNGSGTTGGVGGGGKRGKKRARGQEDALVGGLEGRGTRPISDEEGDRVVAALQGEQAAFFRRLLSLFSMTATAIRYPPRLPHGVALREENNLIEAVIPLLLPAPLLSPALLNLSVRLLLSVHLSPLPAFSEPTQSDQIRRNVRDALESTLRIPEASGTAKGFKGAVIAALGQGSPTTSLLLHPSQPPMLRPEPPLNQLHYFKLESEEEMALRHELGLGRLAGSPAGGDEEDEVDAEWEMEGMELDKISAARPTSGVNLPMSTSMPTSTPSGRAAITAVSAAVPMHVPGSLPIHHDRAPNPSFPISIPPIASGSSSSVHPVATQPLGTTSTPNPLANLPVTETPVLAGTSFIQIPATGKGKEKAVETTFPASQGGSAMVTTKHQEGKELDEEDSDGPIPELDSGSEDEDEEDTDEDMQEQDAVAEA